MCRLTLLVGRLRTFQELDFLLRPLEIGLERFAAHRVFAALAFDLFGMLFGCRASDTIELCRQALDFRNLRFPDLQNLGASPVSGCLQFLNSCPRLLQIAVQSLAARRVFAAFAFREVGVFFSCGVADAVELRCQTLYFRGLPLPGLQKFRASLIDIRFQLLAFPGSVRQLLLQFFFPGTIFLEGNAFLSDGAAKFDHFAGKLEFLLFPLRIGVEKRLLGLLLCFQSLFEFAFQLFPYGLSGPHGIVRPLEQFCDAPLKPRDFTLKLGTLAVPLLGCLFQFFVSSGLDLRNVESLCARRFGIPGFAPDVPAVCQGGFQTVDLAVQAPPLSPPFCR